MQGRLRGDSSPQLCPSPFSGSVPYPRSWLKPKTWGSSLVLLGLTTNALSTQACRLHPQVWPESVTLVPLWPPPSLPGSETPLCPLPLVPACGSGQVCTTRLYPRLSDLSVCGTVLGGGPGPCPAFPGQEGGPELSPGPEPSPAAAAAERSHGGGSGEPRAARKPESDAHASHVPGQALTHGLGDPGLALPVCPPPNG